MTTKTTMSFRPTANPRRTTLASLPVDGSPAPHSPAVDRTELPRMTANPRRTNLMVAPNTDAVPETV